MPALGAFMVVARNSYDEKPSLEGLTYNVALYWQSDACRVSSQAYYNANNITLYSYLYLVLIIIKCAGWMPTRCAMEERGNDDFLPRD